MNKTAASSAVIAAINSKDAICLALTGRTGKSENHAQAVDELRRSGAAGRELSSTLTRLLQLKTRSQYASLSVAAADAHKAVGWANRIHLAAEAVVTDR